MRASLTSLLFIISLSISLSSLAQSPSIKKGGPNAQPALLAIGITGVVTNNTCFDAFNGSINITVTGATAPVSYSWQYNGPFGIFNFATTEDVTGLSPATYTVTVTDGTSATASQSFVVSEPSQVVITLAITQPPCYGSAATIVVSATGGTPPYTGTGTFTTYSDREFTITDANGCTASKTAFVLPPSEMEAYATAAVMKCHDGTTLVTVGANGGTPPYTGTGTFVEGPGFHFYNVTDANGCTGSFVAQVNIPNPPAIVATAIAGTINCFGGTTTLTVTALGGTGAKQYSLNGGNFQVSNTFTVNAAGSPFIVTVRDIYLCSSTTNTVTVTQPAQLTATATSTPVTIPGGSDGTATAIPSGGTSPYTYSWNSSPVQTTVTATGLPAGTYIVTVTDSKGCITTASTTLGAPACTLIASASAGNITCFGGATTLTVTATGGTAPIQYSIDGGIIFQPGNTFTVGAGTYVVTVKDAVPCTVTTNSVTISQPATALAASSTNGTLTCAGTATVTVSATGGMPPYTNTGVQTVTSAGTFNITVTDANGCTSVATGTVAPVVGTCPTITEVIYPKYVQGVGSGVPSADKKVPYACRMKISGLPNPNTSYRYFASFTSTPLIGDNGSGAFIDPEQSGPFVRVTSPSMSSNYGTFTTDFSGNATEWFIIEPTSAADFTPGTQLYLRIVLNSGASTPNEYYRLTASSPVTVLGFGSSSTQGTGLRSTAIAAYTAKNFVMLYDNEAGTGRPESGTFIESDGTANGSAENYAAFYSGNVDGVDKTWGTIIPNNLSTGIRNVSQLKLVDGTLMNKCTSPNGTFGSAVTANTSGGLTEQVMGCTPDVGPLTITGVVTNTRCFDVPDGAINITVLGGTAPYTYSWVWNGSVTFSTTEDVTGLIVGSYVVTVTDAASTVQTATFTITEPPLLVISLAITQPPCYGAAATVVVTATGGTPPYTGTGTFAAFSDRDFTVTDANGCTATKTFFRLAPSELEAYATAGIIPCHDGTTTVTVGANGGTPPYTGTGTFIEGPGFHFYNVTDANGCTGSFVAQVTIPNPPAIVATASAGTIACIGGTTTLTVTATGGHAYQKQYSLNGGAYQTANTFTVNAAGSPYTVTVRETVTLCTVTSNTVTVTQSATALTATATSTDATTPGGSDGTATAIPSGGTGPYTYSWSSSPVQTTITATGLPAGIYIVTVTDSRGCTTTATATVSSPSCTISASASAGTITCFGGTTTLTVTATNGTAPIQYSLNGGAFQAGNTFTVGQGAYSVTVKDVNGCTATNTGTVTQPIPIVVTESHTAIQCNGGTSTVTISATDGVAPYSGTGIFSQSVGTVVYNVTDANGCTGSISITITDPSALVVTSTAPPIACNGGSTIITVSATGGVAPYTGTGTFTRITGTYSFTVTDANGCTTPTNITITEPTVLVASSIAGVAVCGSNGNVIVTATGGTAPYTGTGTISTPIGPYSYTVTDANGCTSITTGTVTCSGTLPLTATIVKNNVSLCGGTNDGAIFVTASGGTPPYTYSWTGETGSNHTPFTAGNVSSITGLNYGYYNVTITDNVLNTITITNIHVEKAFPVYITNSGTASGTCGPTGSLILYGNNGVQPYTYSLNGTTYQGSNTFTGLAAGTYTAYVKDAAGCVNSKSVSVGSLTQVVAAPFARIASICSNDGVIEIYRSGGMAPYTYSLDNITYVSDHIFTNLAPGSYTAYVKDSKGCIGSQAITVGQATAINIYNVKVTKTSACVNDGRVEVYVSGGIGPYSYSLNGTTFQSSLFFSNVAAGSYTITVKDARNCTATTGVTVLANPVVVTAYAGSATSCFTSNGKIMLYLTGGFGPYTYSIDNINFQGTNVFNNLPHGNYTGYVKDSRGCVGTLTGIIVGPLGCRNEITKWVDHIEMKKKAVLKVNVYPNPSSTDFTIVMAGVDNKEKTIISIKDVQGRNIYRSEGNAGKQFTVGKDLIAGIYILEVINGNNKQSIKLVKE
ncbi:MAG: T9SS type A sorting domain-containing protein [Ferruginibacter sp.]